MTQILVLTMHRSGSSVCTRILNMMGAYLGPTGGMTTPNSENPKGFWERRDLRRLDDEVLHEVGADWDCVSSFSDSTLTELQNGPRGEEFERQFRAILKDLNQHRPWALKEPRLCLILPLWLTALDSPVAVIPYRNPLEVAKSLEKRNRIELAAGLALWEFYSLRIVKLAKQIPHVFVSYRQLVDQPAATAQTLLSDLQRLGTVGLSCPKLAEITNFVAPSLYRERANEAELVHRLTPNQLALWKAFSRKHFTPEIECLELSNDTLRILRQYEAERPHAAITSGRP